MKKLYVLIKQTFCKHQAWNIQQVRPYISCTNCKKEAYVPELLQFFEPINKHGLQPCSYHGTEMCTCKNK